MEHSELVDLIADGVDPARGLRWAELGAGTGNFTAALADLLGSGARITAVDRDRGALAALAARLAGRRGLSVATVAADFTGSLGLAALDGVLMANSLHFVREKEPVLVRVREMLRPGGALVVVEYDSDQGNPWVPHPFAWARWPAMAAAAGFTDTRLLARRPSRHLRGMYAAASLRPEA